jgi:hypothetical protein
VVSVKEKQQEESSFLYYTPEIKKQVNLQTYNDPSQTHTHTHTQNKQENFGRK